MRFEVKPSFVKQLQKLKQKDPNREAMLRQTIKEFARMLAKNEPIPIGLGLTKLKGNYWELRSTLADRIIFYRKSDLICWILIGNHNEVRNFLKTV